ncbi:phage portal protein [Kushneria phosphatilytica]|uniref:Phage portal protein n=1 Tax=Kushneria phosphatilytica TaxID=657387 RepID=A0A1S1NXM9_9GAMM|nr:phage portal protein [Kushneria phosphatilytica]OHV12126.1 phage portal protein [Kushneria phosphatilytica]QEL11321.1 phage portal protein [Kushneria phosphatilytica]
MADSNYSVDLQTNSGIWARLVSWFSGGRLVTPDSGQINGPSSAHGHVGESEVTDRRAMQISAVWACVRLLSTMTSSMPIEFYRWRQDESESLEPEHYLSKLFHGSPNAYMSPYDFRKAMNVQRTLFGDAYAFIDRNSAGEVTSLIPLQSPNVDVFLNDESQLRYRVNRSDGFRDYTSDRIFHLKGFGTDGIVSLSPIANASRTLGVAIAMEDQQKEFYANGAKTPKILKTGDKILDSDQREIVKQRFSEMAHGPVNDRLWILEAGFETEDVTISPTDAQTLESRSFQVAEIARIFGVPPHKIGHIENSTSWGSGIEQQNIEFVQSTLMDYFKAWESAIERQLVRPSDRRGANRIRVQHNLETLLRGDSTARANFLSTMTRNGVYTINEARARENLPPVEGGDEPLIQKQNVPLSMAGEDESPAPSGASSLGDKE